MIKNWSIEMKVVINKCFGGFGLSHEGVMRYAELSGMNLIVVEQEDIPEELKDVIPKKYYLNEIADDNYWTYYDLPRKCPYLVQTVEELANVSYGVHAELKVIEIPDDVDWEIQEYDGVEWVAEKHRRWE